MYERKKRKQQLAVNEHSRRRNPNEERRSAQRKPHEEKANANEKNVIIIGIHFYLIGCARMKRTVIAILYSLHALRCNWKYLITAFKCVRLSVCVSAGARNAESWTLSRLDSFVSIALGRWPNACTSANAKMHLAGVREHGVCRFVMPVNNVDAKRVVLCCA